MEPYEKTIGTLLNTDIDIKYAFPWKRLFEVEIEFN
jgi:hypothetical protein